MTHDLDHRPQSERETIARAMFAVDWPDSNWEKLGPGFVQDRYLRMADAAIAFLTPPWQSIATAPKDGTSILVYSKEMDFQEVVSYERHEDRGDWVWATADGPRWHKDAFTHWMPLPAPPAPSPAEVSHD